MHAFVRVSSHAKPYARRTGRPAMMSLMSASTSVALQFLMALAATLAASLPKLLVLNLIWHAQQRCMRNRD
jgi:hypothetical protein